MFAKKIFFFILHRFWIHFNSIKIYCNDNQSRTFISLSIDDEPSATTQSLSFIVKQLNGCLEEFKLPPFYQVNFSFILWQKQQTFIIHSSQNILLQNYWRKKNYDHRWPRNGAWNFYLPLTCNWHEQFDKNKTPFAEAKFLCRLIKSIFRKHLFIWVCCGVWAIEEMN